MCEVIKVFVHLRHTFIVKLVMAGVKHNVVAANLDYSENVFDRLS